MSESGDDPDELHARRFLGRLQSLARRIDEAPRDIESLLIPFDRILPQVTGAFQWASSREFPGPAVTLCTGFGTTAPELFNLRQPPAERAHWLLAALAAARASGDQAAQVVILGNLAATEVDLGNFRRAAEHYQEALRIGCDADRGLVLALLAGLLDARGDSFFARTVEIHRLCAEMARGRGDRLAEERALASLADQHGRRGDVATAAELYETALNLVRELGYPIDEAHLLRSLGLAVLELGDADRAAELATASLTIARRVGDRLCEGHALNVLGMAHGETGRHSLAMDALNRAAALAAAIGDRCLEMNALGNLGIRHAAANDLSAAGEYLIRAWRIACEIGDRRGEVIGLANLGNLYVDLGQWDAAVRSFEQALATATQIGNARLSAQILEEFKELLEMDGESGEWAERVRSILTSHNGKPSDEANEGGVEGIKENP